MASRPASTTRPNEPGSRCRADLPVHRLVEEIQNVGYSAEVVEDTTQATNDVAEIDRRTRSLGRRLVVAAVLFMPLCDLSIAFSLVPRLRFPYWQWVLVVLATPVLTWGAWPFYKAAIRNARHGTSSMDTLVSLGIVAATGWSLYAMFWRDTSSAPRTVLFVLAHQSGGAIYIDVAVGVTTFLLAGRYFEAWSKRRTGNALRSLAAVGAKDVAVLDAMGVEHRLPVAQLAVGDRFVVRPGETVATDGEIVFGHSAIDRSAMTGESLPVDVALGDHVVGGTVSVGGRLMVQATKVGHDTQLAHMVRLVENAQNEKAAVQRLADRIAGVFVPAVLVIALATLAAWLLVGGSTAAGLQCRALGSDHRLPLRTGSGDSHGPPRRLGPGCSPRDLLQGLPSTGGLSTDRHGRARQDRNGHRRKDDRHRRGGCTRDRASHAPALGGGARTGVRAPRRPEPSPLPQKRSWAPYLRSTRSQHCRGSALGEPSTDIRSRSGRLDLFADWHSTVPPNLAARCAAWESLGRTVVLVGRDDTIVGAVAVADTIRPSAASAVHGLQALGLHCVLLSGDNEPTDSGRGR